MDSLIKFKEFQVLKHLNIDILISTIILFFITVGYWLYFSGDSKQNYIFINEVNSLKILNTEIDNAVFNNMSFSQSKLLEEKIKLFERKLYFLRDNPLFKQYFEKSSVLDNKFKVIEKSFLEKRLLLEDLTKLKQELRNSPLIVNTMSMRNEFFQTIVKNPKFTELYQYVMFFIVNGGSFDEFKALEKLVNEFQTNSNNNEINIAIIKDIKRILHLILQIEDIESKIEKHRLLKSIDNFESSLIDEFNIKDSFANGIFYFLVFVSLVLLIILTFLFIKDRKLQNQLNRLNMSLQQRIDKEVKKNREKDKLMFQQAKLASLGEMIGNIAHQWRQPLNNLAIIIQDVENAYLFDEVDENYISNMSKEAMKQISYMSSTIDDFRNFFKNNGQNEIFDVVEAIEKALTITKNSIEANNIVIYKDIRDYVKANGQENQYIQVLINLIKNAQDVINKIKPKKGFIKIALQQKDNFVYLTVDDNGGGVPKDLINKIFEPYFTTKHQATGTGLSLYMSKMIIEQNFHGKLKVENLDSGARFSIITPVVTED